MKNTLKLALAAFVVTIAASCGGEKKEASQADTTVIETPVAPAPDTTTVPADTTAADTTAVQ